MDDQIMNQIRELRTEAVIAFGLLEHDMVRIQRVVALANKLSDDVYRKNVSDIDKESV